MPITSPANLRIKQIRRLLRERKEREKTGSYYIEGLRIVGEAVQVGAEIDSLIVAPELLTSPFGKDLIRQACETDVPVLEVSPEVFKELSVKERPQGIGAVVRQHWTGLAEIQPDRGDLWVALDSVADPGNLGTILRTNDAVGGLGVILLDHSTDPYETSSWRASMGAIFSQRLVRTSLDEFSGWKKRTGVNVVGASGAATDDYHAVQYPDPLVLLMGSERMGLLEAHLWLCDHVVSIPMAGRSDSLNLAVATGVILYEIYHQRKSPGL
ncbi:MAG: RNA methyltransferase [Anaerolineaceae bacterium]|nr:RNA methyltransferase [Anaerolineaceae bacterium]